MNKKMIWVLLFLLPLNAYCYITPNNQIPEVVQGIHVVQDQEIPLTTEEIKQLALRQSAINKQGYIYSDFPNAKTLMSVKYRYKREIDENKDNHNPLDTNLKSSYKEIKLAFPFKEINAIKKESIYGYAAAGGYNKNTGWDGLGILFNDQQIGTCSLALFNIKLSHGGAKFRESEVTYDVNNKPTIYDVMGSPNVGFVYSVSWYDNTFIHDLECAKPDFDKSVIHNMIKKANAIDKEIIQ